jgi:hypothetical protein
MTIRAGAKVDATDLIPAFTQATMSATQSPATATFTAMTFDTDVIDTLDIHDPVTLNTRFVIGKKLGWWGVTAVIPFAGNATGTRRITCALNGTDVNGSYLANPNAGTGFVAVLLPEVLVLATLAADYIEIRGWQDSGAALATVVSGAMRPRATLTFKGTG